MGIILGKLGKIDEAIAYSKKALAIKKKINTRKYMISTLNQLCELLVGKGNLAEARAYCE